MILTNLLNSTQKFLKRTAKKTTTTPNQALELENDHEENITKLDDLMLELKYVFFINYYFKTPKKKKKKKLKSNNTKPDN